MQRWFTGIGLILLTASAVARDLPLHLIKLPVGFKIELYADTVPGARSISMSPAGTLFVGSRQTGKVYAIRDTNHDGRGDRVYVLAQGLDMPNGVAFHNGALYVAEVSRIIRFDDIENRLANPLPPVIVSVDFPSEQHHGWKFIRIGPDEKLYVPIGAPCNVCLEYGYAAITRLNLDGSQHEIYAEGVRNTVGFDWHPDSKELWFTDNGRDQLGDNLPPDELNHATDEGLHFGFPYCHGGEILDPEFGLGHGCSEYVAPAQKLGAHVAALGMRFYIGDMFPAHYQKQIFIAEHGSWNRSEKSGYRITLVRLNGKQAVSYESFAEGWLQGQKAWGRPVDIEHMADGSLLVSDDKAGAIYRIYYDGSQPDHIPLMTHEKMLDNKMVHPASEPTPAMQKPRLDGGETTRQLIPASLPSDEKNNPTVIPEQENKSIGQELSPILLDNQQNVQDMKQQETSPSGNTSTNVIEPIAEDIQPPVDNKNAIPPADVIEKIRARTEQDVDSSVDPFSSVKKQTINE